MSRTEPPPRTEAERHTGLWPRYERKTDNHPDNYPDSWLTARNRRGELVWNGYDREIVTAFFKHVGLGPHKSPAAVGMAMQEYYQLPKGKHSFPSKNVINMLKENPSYERVERWGSGKKPPGDDIPMAYTRHCTRLPCGTACRIVIEPIEEEEIAAWYCRCRITLPELGEAQIGLFPLSPEEQAIREVPNWPRTAGEYEACIWAETCADIRAAGGTVTVLSGWGWHDLTEDLTEWAEEMIRLRDTAPGGPHGAVAHLVKMAANASIGLHGCGYLFEVECDSEDPACTRDQVDSNGRFTGRGWKRIEGRRTMVHWHRYIAMQVSRAVRRMAEAYLRTGHRVWSIEVDCVRVVYQTGGAKAA